MKERKFTCIVCPKGCRITVNEEGEISGYTCLRGLNYVKQELVDPRRTLTSTFKVKGGNILVCPCKSSDTLPKDKVKDVVKEIAKLEIEAPVLMHQVIIKDVLGLGVDIISTKEIPVDAR